MGGSMTTFEFYTDSYLSGREAVFDTASFPFWERKASQAVRKYTFGNIDESEPISEVVQGCVCEVAELLYEHDLQKRKNDGIASEKVGEYSVSYRAEKSTEEKEREVNGVVREWLANTGFLYCGGV